MADRSVEAAIRRGRVFWWEDGIADLVMGCWFLLWGLVHLGVDGGHLGLLVSHLAAVPVAAGVVLFTPAVRRCKRLVAEPRVGFAERRPPEGNLRVLFGVLLGAVCIAGAVLTLLVIVGPTVLTPSRLDLLLSLLWPVGTGAVVAVGWSLLAVTTSRQPRHGVIAAVAGLGMLMPAAGLRGEPAGGLLFVAVGATMLVTGALALRTFLRRHPLPA